MTKKQPAIEAEPEAEAVVKRATLPWEVILAWAGTIILVAIMLAVLLQYNPFKKAAPAQTEIVENGSTIELPALTHSRGDHSIIRVVSLDTDVPEGVRHFAVKYTVEEGDSIFAIAKLYNLQPESILWANYDLLHDDPTFLAPGWRLTIPPTDGIYYQWKEGDTLEKIAEKYFANVADIIRWPSNHMDITNPSTEGLEYVMIPDGFRPIQSWIVPLAFTPGSGATRVILGPGSCPSTGYALIGSTGFIWPAGNHSVSGFDFTSYHLGIDIAAGEGAPVYASDSGTVTYAGWNDSGYGYMVVIDHGNGYETLYGHLSQVSVGCGQGVYAGTMIGTAGNTGRSYGAHLHFEVRLNGGFVNPWSVLN
ncbi:MAG: peptidoglycan DD-metalloendopeptidase family protein [Anaerolineaceae bacterium]|nr:peptidoglycan DD-metalloendopeptidase family protein [Anaerolineaceae bacterium]